ncbi:MAG: class I SAM-dependent methyltransferase [Holophagales bacterium]|nr:class I SAM-dependent methyltransferase [Holophagales bacterium]
MIWRRLRLYLSMVRYGWRHNRDFAREHYAVFQRLQRDLEPHFPNGLGGVRVLEVGSGKMMWLTLLLASCGARATGIDTEWAEPGFSPLKYVRIARANGLERAVRTLVWDALFARSYYRELAAIAPFELRFDRLDARRTSVTELELEPGAFDLVVSHEVFEHLPDVEAALARLARVLDPRGLTYIYIHNFSSVSGGHHIAWKYPDTEPSETVPPWDHLRDRRFPDIPSWINGWREGRYREAFERHFEILDWLPGEREGEALLTPELRSELAAYTEDELLTKGFTVVARPLASCRLHHAE